MKYPYEEGPKFIPRTDWEMLARTFEINNCPEARYGKNVFIYDKSKLESLDNQELCRVALIIHFNAFAMNCKGERTKINKSVFKTIQKRGIGEQEFIDHTIDFEFEGLGEEAGQSIAHFAGCLRLDKVSKISVIGHFSRAFRHRYRRIKTIIDSVNAKPYFALDSVIKLDAKPVCLRYNSKRLLYVLDEFGVVSEFSGKNKRNSWDLELDDWVLERFRDVGGMHLFDYESTRPSICVENDILFLTYGRELTSFNLDEQKKGKSSKGKLTRKSGDLTTILSDALGIKKGLEFHDVLIKEGNVFVSVSEEMQRRFILQVTPKKTQVVYEGKFPVSEVRCSQEDLTLRLDLLEGHIYFAEGNGLKSYAGLDAKDMLSDIIAPYHPSGEIIALTKFALGSDYLVTSSWVDKSEQDIICFFKPEYTEKSSSLVRKGIFQRPDKFTLVQCVQFPRITGDSMVAASISATDNHFAVSNNYFKRVYVYKVK